MTLLGFFLGFAFWALVTAAARKKAEAIAREVQTELVTGRAKLMDQAARLAASDEELRRREASVEERERLVDKATVAVQEMYAAVQRRREEPVTPVIDITEDAVVDVAGLFDRSPEGRKLLS